MRHIRLYLALMQDGPLTEAANCIQDQLLADGQQQQQQGGLQQQQRQQREQLQQQAAAVPAPLVIPPRARPLDAEQQAAAAAPLGQVLTIEAGAGSGKTTTMVERVVHLLTQVPWPVPCSHSHSTLSSLILLPS